MVRLHKLGNRLGKVERKRRVSIKSRKTGGVKVHYKTIREHQQARR
jgi:hypothetical protein